MRTINFSDLPLLGINPLTGEACAFSMRVLCDLNEAGCTLLRDYLGLSPNTKFADAWNYQVNNQPAVGSVMLDRDAFGPLVLFAMFRQGYEYVLTPKHSGVGHQGFSAADFDKYPELVRVVQGESHFILERSVLRRNLRPKAQVEGSRNVHQFTGRAL